MILPIIIFLLNAEGVPTEPATTQNKEDSLVSELNFLNKTSIPLLPLNNVSRGSLNNYTALINLDPIGSFASVDLRIDYKNPTTQNLTLIPLNHWLLSFESSYVPNNEKNNPAFYPGGFQDIQLTYIDAKVNNLPVNLTRSQTHIRLNGTNVLPGATATIDVKFNTSVPISSRRYSKMIGSTGEVVFSFAHLLPNLPIYKNNNFRTDRFVSRGEPFVSDVAFYNVTVQRPTNFTIGATGKVVKDFVVNDTRSSTYEAFPVRDWAMTGSKDYIEDIKIAVLPSGRQVEVQSLYLRSSSNIFASQATFAVRAIQYFSSLFTEYAHDNYVSAETISFFGGMEYPQLALITSTSSKHFLDRVVAHEVGHQWNWVMTGMDQTRETWLDEGLTTFFEDLYMLHQGRISRDVFIQDHWRILADSKIVETPINRTIYNADEFFGFLSYSKNGRVFYDLLNTLGEDVFIPILKNFYRTTRFRIATAQNLIDLIVNQLSQTWPRFYFDVMWNTAELPNYELNGTLLGFNSTASMVEIEIHPSHPGLVQKLELEAFNKQGKVIRLGLLVNQTTKFNWTISFSLVDKIHININNPILASTHPAVLFTRLQYLDFPSLMTSESASSSSSITTSSSSETATLSNTASSSSSSTGETALFNSQQNVLLLSVFTILANYLRRGKNSINWKA